MYPEDAHKTGVSSPYGHYKHVRMVMGLRKASCIFQSLMDLVLGGLQGFEQFVYLDDKVVFAKDLKEHDIRFRRLLK